MQYALHKRKASDLVPPAAAADMQLSSSVETLDSAPSLSLRLGAHSLQGLTSKLENEDTYVACRLPWLEGAGEAVQGHVDHAAAAAAAAAAGRLPPMHLLAIFDGHSSASVSRLCELQLPAVLTQQLLQATAGGAALDDAAYQRALQGAFEQLDALVTPLDNAGSTATAAIVTADRIHLAWVGDSRAVLLGRGGAVLAATPEHRASREDEQERVVAAGGAVLNNQGALRVMGVLQCTRAIGDKDLQAYGVIPRPEVLSVPRSSQAEFLVLATDGLWDVLANEEVYQYAHKTLQKVADRCPRVPSANGACCGCQAAGVAARALSQCARKQRGSRDDITVLLANMAAACQCLKPPTLLSSSSKGAAAGSLRGTCGGGGGGSVACDGMPSSSSNAVVAPLHSSPAALDAGATQAQHPWHHQQQPQPSHPPQLPDAVAKQPQQQPQQHDQGAADGTAARHQAVRQCVRHDAPPWPAGLQLHPSVAPSLSAAGSGGSSGVHHHAAAAADGGGGAALARGGVLSDLALSSPFAMMLCHDASAKGLDVDHVLHAAVAGKSAPPGMISGALLAAADRVGRSAPASVPATLLSGDAAGAARKRSLSAAALVSSRSCGSVGAQGRLGSSELPVVVLT